jgi:hypothetical protein
MPKKWAKKAGCPLSTPNQITAVKVDGIAPIFYSLRFHNLPRPVIEGRLSETMKLHSAKITPLLTALQRGGENPLLKKP